LKEVAESNFLVMSVKGVSAGGGPAVVWRANPPASAGLLKEVAESNFLVMNVKGVSAGGGPAVVWRANPPASAKLANSK